MNKRNSDTKNKKPRTYPVQFKDETRYVTVPGSGDPQPGPDGEAKLETFLAEAIEAYSEMSDIVQPRVATFEKAGYSKTENGLVIRVGQIEYRLTITRSH